MVQEAARGFGSPERQDVVWTTSAASKRAGGGDRVCRPATSLMMDASSMVLRDHALLLVREGRREGLRIRLAGVGAGGTGSVWGPNQDRPPFVATLLALDENLRIRPLEITGATKQDVDAWFAVELPRQRRLHEESIRLRTSGAAGTIDGVALGCILLAPKPAATLQRLCRTTRIELHDGTVLMWEVGRVTSSGTVAGRSIAWLHDHVRITGMTVPETVCAALVGRPLSDLVDWPSFSGDITIVEAACSKRNDLVHLDVRVSTGCHAFDTAGRHWPLPAPQSP